VLLSLYLAGTITQPIVRLARAADEIRLARESAARDPRPRHGAATRSATSTTHCAR
jgi:hypothetical protein